MAVAAEILRPDRHALVSLDGLGNTVNSKTFATIDRVRLKKIVQTRLMGMHVIFILVIALLV
jgi:hypothetical protein